MGDRNVESMPHQNCKIVALKRSVRVRPDGQYIFLAFNSHTFRMLQKKGELDFLRLLELLQVGVCLDSLPDELSGSTAEIERLLAVLRSKSMLMHPIDYDTFHDSRSVKYDRLLAYFGNYESAERTRYDMLGLLERSHVCVVGMGSFSSWLVTHLATSGVGRITIIDGDKVALSNLSRQALFGHADLGVSKIDVARRELCRISETVVVAGQARYISDEGEARRALCLATEEAPAIDLVVSSADRPSFRIWEYLTTACRELKLPLLTANTHRIGPMHLGDGTACACCQMPGLLARDAGFEDYIDYRNSARATPAATSATVSTIVASTAGLAAHEVLGYLSQAWSAQTVNAQLVLNFTGPAYELDHKSYLPAEDCRICRVPRF